MKEPAMPPMGSVVEVSSATKIENPRRRSLAAGVSEIEEDERKFTPEEVYASVEQLEGVNRADFTHVELVTNSAGALVQVNFRLSPEAVASKGFKCPTGYEFLLKTKPGTKSGSTTTKIDRIDYNAQGGIDWAEPIAELKDGAWVKQ